MRLVRDRGTRVGGVAAREALPLAESRAAGRRLGLRLAAAGGAWRLVRTRVKRTPDTRPGRTLDMSTAVATAFFETLARETSALERDVSMIKRMAELPALSSEQGTPF